MHWVQIQGTQGFSTYIKKGSWNYFFQELVWLIFHFHVSPKVKVQISVSECFKEFALWIQTFAKSFSNLTQHGTQIVENCPKTVWGLKMPNYFREASICRIGCFYSFFGGRGWGYAKQLVKLVKLALNCASKYIFCVALNCASKYINCLSSFQRRIVCQSRWRTHSWKINHWQVCNQNAAIQKSNSTMRISTSWRLKIFRIVRWK